MDSMPITAKAASLISADVESKIVNDMRHVGGFPRTLITNQ